MQPRIVSELSLATSSITITASLKSAAADQNKTSVSKASASSSLKTSNSPSVNILPNDAPTYRTIIIGGGIIGSLEAYYAIKEAKSRGIKLHVKVYEKNESILKTTAANIFPSLTPDEIVSVVPSGKALTTALTTPFNQPRGIRVSDVKGIDNSDSGNRFIQEALAYSKDEKGHNERTATLLALGRMSMNEWKNFYDQADSELQEILHHSNFNPCMELEKTDQLALHKGYRIDLMSGMDNAKKEALSMKSSYEQLGYKSCKVLTPNEVVTLDPSLKDFCESHSEAKDAKTPSVREWKNDSIALYRPGGCIDARAFLPQFHAYLAKLSGNLPTADGKTEAGFAVHYNHKVEKVNLDSKSNAVIGLEFSGSNIAVVTPNYKQTEYVFCPGEAVGTLEHVGFIEPARTRFAGASLTLEIPFEPSQLSADELAQINSFNHCMEVHKVGVVLAWQARTIGDKICIGVAGTKAFYADQEPQVNQAFAVDRNLLQLNMINDVLPQFISRALGKNTKGQTLTMADLQVLEQKGIARRWVGSRAVAYDGFPILGPLYNSAGQIPNARVTTGLGSGGVSFSHGAVLSSRAASSGASISNPLVHSVLMFGNSRRTAIEQMKSSTAVPDQKATAVKLAFG